MKSPTDFEKEAFAATDLELPTSPEVYDISTASENSPVEDISNAKHFEESDKEFDENSQYEEHIFADKSEQSVPGTTKTRQEAKQVCGKISRLLRDKQSRARGSCMFRKRRRRSEKFAIIGYGTQPVDEDPVTDSSSGQERSDSIFLSSTDDEIPVYDRPGPNNLLEQDIYLNTSEKIVQNQLRGLAMDAVQMKGKGAKLFARRQRRMEKFVLESSADEATPNASAATSNNLYSHASNKSQPGGEEARSSYTPVSYNNIHAGRPSTVDAGMQQRREPGRYDVVTSEDGSGGYTQPHKRGRRSRPRDRMPWNSPGNFATADWSTDDEAQYMNIDSAQPAQQQMESEDADRPQIQQRRFRSVKPPTPSVVPPQVQNILPAPQPASVQTVDFKRPKEFTDSSRKPPTSGKRWSSVAFQPKTPKKTNAAEPSERVAYPFALSANTAPALKVQPTPVWNMNSSRRGNAVRSRSSARAEAKIPLPPPPPPASPSVSLLQQPMTRSRSPSPYREVESNIQQEMKADPPAITVDAKPNSVVRSVHGDFQEDSEPLQPKPAVTSFPLQNSNVQPKPATASNGMTDLPPQNKTEVPSPPKFYRPSPSPAFMRPIVQPQSDQNEAKPKKVAACMKLLDPSKGKYEPKMELVYKQTPSIGAELDETTGRPPSRNASHEPQQFNKPVPVNYNQPQISYVQQNCKSNPAQEQNKPQALGSIAGEMKGKGAKMFAKQQQRMDRYTKECNGNKQPEIVQPTLPSHGSSQAPKAPGKKTRESMSQVLGEFRKVSDADSPKRPSATRRSKTRDPLHYQQFYVVRRPPSAADFVCVDDANDAASDSNNSATSSLTSFDRASTSSSGKQHEYQASQADDVSENGNSHKKPPPKVAPKPKLRKLISSEATPPVVLPAVQTEGEFQSTENDQEIIPDHNNVESEETENYEGAKPEKIVAEPAFKIWSPGQPTYQPPSLDHLPPPPSYQEVTSQGAMAPKPTFRAPKPYSAYTPGASNSTFDMGSFQTNLPSVQNVKPASQFTVPRPKFTTNTPVAKWQPSSKQ